MNPTTILVAEDNREDAFLLERAVRRAQVRAALKFTTDGQEAVDYLAGTGGYANRLQHPFPTLMLLDLKMPRLDGFDVLDWIHRQPFVKRLPVIVMTSSQMAGDVNRAYDLGANSFVVKPMHLEGLDELIKGLKEFWLKLNRYPNCEAGNDQGHSD
ncbi:MAG TPA: response regulator [Verrucomicrobiae bacterium]|nr:response regulator [Verrucomicrobiae bacterium]